MSKSAEWLRDVTAAGREVMKALGDIAYNEEVYEQALCHELRIRGIPHERQRNRDLIYKGCAVGTRRADFIVNPLWATKKSDEQVLESKAVKTITKCLPSDESGLRVAVPAWA